MYSLLGFRQKLRDILNRGQMRSASSQRNKDKHRDHTNPPISTPLGYTSYKLIYTVNFFFLRNLTTEHQIIVLLKNTIHISNAYRILYTTTKNLKYRCFDSIPSEINNVILQHLCIKLISTGWNALSQPFKCQ